MLKKQAYKDNIFLKYKEDSPESIECRRIYAKLKNLKSPQKINNVMITSSISGEGKSTISSILAITCARYEMGNTLLIDYDLRRPQIHNILDIEKENGLAEILQGEISPLKAIKNTAIENLKVITCGSVKEKPTKLINSSRIEQFFKELKNNFETIIFDTPPVLPVSDSLILSSIVEATVLIIKVGKTKKEIVKRAVDLLNEAGVNTISILANNLESVLPYYYEYQYYGYNKYNS